MSRPTETVFITGATAGIGEACARRFAAAGDNIIITGRRAERLDALKASLPGQVHATPLDVQDKAAVDAAVAGLPETFRNVTVLVNNAGLAQGIEPAQKSNMADWETMVDTNIKGLLYVTRALLPGMVERNRGHVFNLGSVAGSYPYPGGNVYCGTKAFVNHFSLAVRSDLLGTMVRMTSVEPGMTDTEFSTVRFKGDKSKADQVYAGTRPMTGDDIAEAIFQCNRLPDHVNVNRIELMPVQQAFSPFAVSRG